ncbi:MAG: glycosyltransferase, partial [Alteraurantiacibacter sp.]
MRRCTVIIPAYNEEAVIGRCLSALLADAPSDHGMEIIVAANGCRDETVGKAREAAPGVRIIGLEEGSKTRAINAANAIASHYPRVFVDADVICSYTTIMALVEALDDPDAMTAAPAIRMQLREADPFVRAYFRVWLTQPYALAGYGGAGCYALSRTALEEVGPFPDIIGDDIWIHTRFPKSQKRYVSHDAKGNPVFTVVMPPRSATAQIGLE